MEEGVCRGHRTKTHNALNGPLGAPRLRKNKLALAPEHLVLVSLAVVKSTQQHVALILLARGATQPRIVLAQLAHDLHQVGRAPPLVAPHAAQGRAPSAPVAPRRAAQHDAAAEILVDARDRAPRNVRATRRAFAQLPRVHARPAHARLAPTPHIDGGVE